MRIQLHGPGEVVYGGIQFASTGFGKAQVVPVGIILRRGLGEDFQHGGGTAVFALSDEGDGVYQLAVILLGPGGQ